MAYILAVNPSIFSALSVQGMDVAASFTATGIAAVVGTLVMACYANCLLHWLPAWDSMPSLSIPSA